MVPDTDASPDLAIAELINTMNLGQFLILAEAIRQLGGELRIDWRAYGQAALEALPKVEVDMTDGPVVIRLRA